MFVGVCDFPGSYAFPPAGYGGIERWLWAVAVGARAVGADAHLLGPGWRRDLGPEWTRKPIRLEDTAPRSTEVRELRSAGYDLLVVGQDGIDMLYKSARTFAYLEDSASMLANAADTLVTLEDWSAALDRAAQKARSAASTLADAHIAGRHR